MIKKLREIGKKATEGPWAWVIHDYSMASIEGKKGMESHVLSVSPCKSCQENLSHERKWQFGRCTTPKDEDAKFITTARNVWDALLDVVEEAQAFKDADIERMASSGKREYDLKYHILPARKNNLYEALTRLKSEE